MSPEIANIVADTVAVVVVGGYVVAAGSVALLSIEDGRNDDTLVSNVLLGLVNEAERSIVICDDGDQPPGVSSVYDDQDVVDAIARRLDEKPELKIRCFFSSDDQTAFVSEFEGCHDRVTINRIARQDVHFKIIDGGRKAYVSAHRRGAQERNFRLYDCTWVAPWARKVLLGHHVKAAEAAVV